MNEITLVRDFGPDAPQVTDAALAKSRTSLLAEIAGSTVATTSEKAGISRRLVLRGGLPVAAVAVAVLAAVIVVQGATLHAPSTPHGITLAAYQTPEFPLALQPLPPGLSKPVFELSDRQLTARFTSGTDVAVSIYVSPDEPQRAPDPKVTHSVTVEGVPATLTAFGGGMEDPAPRALELAWRRHAGQWVEIVAGLSTRYGTQAALVALADHLVDAPQRIPLRLRLAPQGWVLSFFKDNSILTLSDPDDPARVLTVDLQRAMDPDFSRSVGARSVSSVRVAGLAGQIARTGTGWALQAPFEDGSAFELQAPGDLSERQVVLIAEGVSHG